MTRDDIIKLAREAGMLDLSEPGDAELLLGELERFAALVAAAEREQCAQVCERIDTFAFGGDRPAPNDCAAAIRARSQA